MEFEFHIGYVVILLVRKARRTSYIIWPIHACYVQPHRYGFSLKDVTQGTSEQEFLFSKSSSVKKLRKIQVICEVGI